MCKPAIPVTHRIDLRLSRHDFLDLAWKSVLVLCGLLGLNALARFFDYSTEPPQPTEYDAGPAESYPLGSRTAIPEAGAILLHAAGGFRAFSTLCPHLGCTVELSREGFVCPCHASRFDAQGAVVKGPAARPLAPLRVEQADNGHAVIHLS